jgi:hypothetical protein
LETQPFRQKNACCVSNCNDVYRTNRHRKTQQIVTGKRDQRPGVLDSCMEAEKPRIMITRGCFALPLETEGAALTFLVTTTFLATWNRVALERTYALLGQSYLSHVMYCQLDDVAIALSTDFQGT